MKKTDSKGGRWWDTGYGYARWDGYWLIRDKNWIQSDGLPFKWSSLAEKRKVDLTYVPQNGDECWVGDDARSIMMPTSEQSKEVDSTWDAEKKTHYVLFQTRYVRPSVKLNFRDARKNIWKSFDLPELPIGDDGFTYLPLPIGPDNESPKDYWMFVGWATESLNVDQAYMTVVQQTTNYPDRLRILPGYGSESTGTSYSKWTTWASKFYAWDKVKTNADWAYTSPDWTSLTEVPVFDLYPLYIPRDGLNWSGTYPEFKELETQLLPDIKEWVAKKYDATGAWYEAVARTY